MMTVQATAIDAYRLRRLYGSFTTISRLYSRAVIRYELDTLILVERMYWTTWERAERPIAWRIADVRRARLRSKFLYPISKNNA